MALAINKVNSCVSVPPIIDIRGADSEAKYIIRKGGSQVNTRRVGSNSSNNTNIQWTMPPPSEKTFVDRQILVEIPITVDITGPAPGVGNLIDLNSGTSSLRFLPLQNALINNINLQIGSPQFTQNSSELIEPLCRYTHYGQKLQQFTGSPVYMDQSQVYASLFGGNNNPMGNYADGSSNSVEKRGAYGDLVVSVNTPTQLTFSCTLYEYLMISPLAFGPKEETAFIGINSMELTLNLNSNLSRIISHDSTNGNPLTAINVNVGAVSYAHLRYITPRVTTPIPKNMSYPFFNLETYITPVGTVNAGVGSGAISSNAIQFNQVPRKVYVFARQTTGSRTYLDPDCYMRMDDVSINFGNVSGVYSNANSFDLWRVSVENGCQLTYSQWRSQVGSVFCLDFGKDMPMNPTLACDVLENIQFQLTANFTNISSVNRDYSMYIIAVFGGVVSVTNGMVSRQLGVVSHEQTIDETIETIPMVDNYSLDETATFYGGKSLEKLLKLGKKLLPAAKFGAMAMNRPEIAGVLQLVETLVGEGMDEDKAIKKALKMRGNGVVGGELAPSLAGGAKMSKDKLKKRLL
jgi:hypothetical protein